nr:hypothetical protein [Tanacetum cinerariifolium]
MPHNLPLPRVNTLRGDEGSMTLNELMVLCTKLLQKVDSLEVDLKQTNQIYRASYTKIIMKVKGLGRTIKSSQVRRRAKIFVSDDEELEDPSKQGRKVAKIHTCARRKRAISTASSGIITTEELVSTVGASMPVSSASMVDKKRQRIARVHEEASSFNVDEWEDIQATIEANEELALRIQAEEREKYFEAKKARLLRFNKDDLIKLEDLVKERFSTIEPTDEKEKEL